MENIAFFCYSRGVSSSDTFDSTDAYFWRRSRQDIDLPLRKAGCPSDGFL